ncbi:hypothetical protein SCHPADRAFT_900408 [Schizopora paradoxa]|uniref:Uncharacterized protein n=1 Tax=Schizopora paradoxa TaxID=27342 RepID=A0A0H2SKQ7_9AGAM|nr:hypothetical protein SCHPADRAFT_900408 [Schizopora paradoxa]
MSGSDSSLRRVVDKTRRVMRARRKHTMLRGTSTASSMEDIAEDQHFPINLEALRHAVSRFFGRACISCSKLTDGGFHSIYVLQLEEDITDDPDLPVEVIARVALPTFSHDKMESEAATKLYIRARTNVPVPKIHFWDSDPDNPVGAEYMVVERVPGESAADVWDTFSKDQKSFVMEQLAGHISEVFNLRIESIGSLYVHKDHLKRAWKKSMKLFDKDVDDDATEFEVGPVVCTLYCSDPEDEFPRSHVKNPNRGPFKSAGEWLSSILEYELAFTQEHHEEALEESVLLKTPPDSNTAVDVDSAQSKGRRQRQLEFARISLSSLMDLAKSYCGPAVDGPQGHLSTQFSLLHHDFQLSNLQVDPQTAQILGILDWEATHSTPLWACARLPNWLAVTSPLPEQDEDVKPSIRFGGDEDTAPRISRCSTRPAVSAADYEEAAELRKVFLEHVCPEWREAYEVGRDWQQFQEICCLNWMSWTEPCMRERIDLYREQAMYHPGVPLNEQEVENRIRGSKNISVS